MKPNKIVIAGGSGFLGQTLATYYRDREVDIVILARQPETVETGRAVFWDGKNPGPWTNELDGALAVINLAGRSVNCRYHARNRDLILNSRIDSTRVLGEAIRKCRIAPAAWLNSSTATIYRHTHGPAHPENGDIGPTPIARDDFSVSVARRWEEAFTEATVADATRKIVLRTAMVIGAQPGGVYEVLRRLAALRLGGRMGNGKQFVSWLHALDFCRAVDWLITSPDATGVYNLSAPEPLPNAAMMKTLREGLGVRLGLPAPAFLLEIGAFFLRTETELVIKSRRVIPQRLINEGFAFRFSDFASAVNDLETTLNHAPRIPHPN